MASLTTAAAPFGLSGAIDAQLVKLRTTIDDFARRPGDEHGESNEAALRAEPLSAAIQRLEWALARQPSRSRHAIAGQLHVIQRSVVVLSHRERGS